MWFSRAVSPHTACGSTPAVAASGGTVHWARVQGGPKWAGWCVICSFSSVTAVSHLVGTFAGIAVVIF